MVWSLVQVECLISVSDVLVAVVVHGWLREVP